MGKPPISAELCGGTHVWATGEIGFFLIISESSIGTGLRRIEAVTGREAEALIQKRFSILDNIADHMKSSPLEANGKVQTLLVELAEERKRSETLERNLLKSMVGTLLEQAEQVNGVTVLAAKVQSSSMPALREMGDLLRDRLKSAVIVLGAICDDKPNFVAMVSPDLLGRGLHAGEIVKQVAGVAGGSGGGKPGMAQAGGKDKGKLDEALELVAELVRKIG